MNSYSDNKSAFYNYSTNFYTEYDKTEIKIRNFSLLLMGWNYGEGDLIGFAVISKAIELYRFGKANGFNGDAFPMINGGINLSLYINEYALDITINTELKISIEVQKGLGQNYEVIDERENADYSDIYLLLNEIRTACSLSESCLLQGIITPVSKDSKAPHSSTPQGVWAVSPLLNSTAQGTLPVMGFVSI